MSKFLVMASWNDVPHLTEKEKKEILDSTPPHLQDAKVKGVPQLGAGSVYPISEEEIKVEPFEIPPDWPRAFALDVGWKKTAAIWGAYNKDEDIIYFYSEYYRGLAEPAVHSQAIKSRGTWIPGVFDPHARDRAQKDGTKLIHEYQALLDAPLFPAENAKEAGIFNVWERMTTGRLKVFNYLTNFFMEFRIYRRDENGKVVKENDHLMDTFRYWCMSALDVAIPPPLDDEVFEMTQQVVNKTTGY